MAYGLDFSWLLDGIVAARACRADAIARQDIIARRQAQRRVHKQSAHVQPHEDDWMRDFRIAWETPSYHGTSIELPVAQRAE